MPDLSPTQRDAIEALRQLIERSGLPARQFAERVLLRDERTVRRWLAGTSPIPSVVIRNLDRLTVRARGKRAPRD